MIGPVLLVLFVHEDRFTQVVGVAEAMEAVVAEVRFPEVEEVGQQFAGSVIGKREILLREEGVL